MNSAGFISNVEIQGLISLANSDNPDGVNISQYQDEGDILVYNRYQWISWLTPNSYNERRKWYDGLNFGGSADWAVDLNRTYGNNGTGDLQQSDDDGTEYGPCPTTLYNNLYDLLNAQDLSTRCIVQMALRTLINMFDVAYSKYLDVNNGYDELYPYYVTCIEKSVPNLLTNDFMLNMSITGDYRLIPEIGYGMQCMFSFAPPLSLFPDCNPILSYTAQGFGKSGGG